jgi:hypothetical protein
MELHPIGRSDIAVNLATDNHGVHVNFGRYHSRIADYQRPVRANLPRKAPIKPNDAFKRQFTLKLGSQSYERANLMFGAPSLFHFQFSGCSTAIFSKDAIRLFERRAILPLSNGARTLTGKMGPADGFTQSRIAIFREAGQGVHHKNSKARLVLTEIILRGKHKC